MKLAYDDTMAHKIEAGADIFLMPSRYEPCGLSQIYSLKYGTVPVVHATGGLDDTIEEWDPAAGTGTGFKFYPYDPAAFMAALDRAFTTFADKAAWWSCNGTGWRRTIPGGSRRENIYGCTRSACAGGAKLRRIVPRGTINDRCRLVWPTENPELGAQIGNTVPLPLVEGLGHCARDQRKVPWRLLPATAAHAETALRIAAACIQAIGAEVVAAFVAAQQGSCAERSSCSDGRQRYCGL